MNKVPSVGRWRQPKPMNSNMNVSSDRSVLGSKNHSMSKAQPTMIDLLTIVAGWLAGLRLGGDAAAGSQGFLPSIRPRRGLRRGNDRVTAAFLDIGWMTVRLDSLSCVRVLSGSSSAWRGSPAWCTSPRYGGV
ncbi:MAG: hypothetical protein WCB27_21600 [Thermoguttaceae bacterium]